MQASPRIAATFVLGLLTAASCGQEQRAKELAQRLAEQPKASVAWFATSVELCWAQSEYDMGAAIATATATFEVAREGAPAGAREASAAAVARLVARTEGPRAALPWSEIAGWQPPTAAPQLRFQWLYDRCRFLCFVGDHAKELQFSIPAQALADEMGDDLAKLRAAMVTMHATPRRGLAEVRKQYQAMRQGPQAAEVATLSPYLLLEEVSQLQDQHRFADAERPLGAAENQARQQGNQRALAMAECYRGNAAALRRDTEAAMAHYTTAAELYARLGDRFEWASVLDMLAFGEVQRGAFDAADARLREVDALIADREFSHVEMAILRTRLELAVKRSDGELAAATAREIERRQNASRELDERIVEARNQVRVAEEQREAAAEQLRAEREQAAAQAASTRNLLISALVASLTMLVGLSWWSRRRLLQANGQLATQVERAEAAQQSRDRMEQRMRQMQQAESLGTLAAGVAHDFNNLLTSVLGNAELLRMQVKDPEAVSCIDTIDAAGRQAARLCKQLQTYGGDGPSASMTLDLVTLVQEMLPVLASSTRGRIEVRFNAPAESVGVVADPAEIEQVLLNLVVNAADARAKVVRISLQRHETALGFDGPAAEIAVEDDGDGMTPEVAQRIFDPFFTTRFPGRGLGLAVVHGVVRRHGGSIQVDSAPGLGAKFTIELPLAVVTPGAAAEPGLVLPAGPRPTSSENGPAGLVVDDEPTVGQLLVRMLASLGRAGEYLASGARTLDRVDELPRDRALVVFVDLTMPEMDGAELIRRLRPLRPDVRIVLMSGHTTDMLEQASLAQAPEAVLSKPFQLAAVRAALASALAAATTTNG